MKKIIFFFLIFFAMGFVITKGAEIHGNIQFGYIPEAESFESEINIQFLPWHWLELYSGINVLMSYSGYSTFFFPYQDRYSVGAKINVTDNLYFDLYHHCAHPVYSNRSQFWDRFAGGNKTRVAIGVEW